MEDEFLDPEEEFQMMYADDLELLNEMDDEPPEILPLKPVAAPSTRRSLNFSSPKTLAKTSKKPVQTPNTTLNDDARTLLDDISRTLSDDMARTLSDDIAPLSQSSECGKKRTVEDVFGDIDDIELEEAMQRSEKGHAAKRSRTLEPIDMFFSEDDFCKEPTRDSEADLIDKINLMRKKALLESEQGRIAATSPSGFKGNSNIMTKGVPKWPFVPITSELGKRAYIRVRSEEHFDEQCNAVTHRGQVTGLLRIPYSSLKETALKVLEKKQERAIAAQEAEIAGLVSSDDGISEALTDNGELWVEKFKPKCYAELLSDESINRTLLRWLKLWDKVVFNREKKVRQKPKEEKKDGRFQKKQYGQVLSEELDEHGRPEHKMVLLCGPPGLGKTTLAHMVATLAGYNVVEVNASDDRSPEAFRTQLEAATQMRSVLGENPRPNCLVMDEIDGAPAASIETLLKFVLGKDVGKGRGKKKGQTAGILKRPVICVCNDAYVPALRPLRQASFVIQFPPTASERLATRLVDIARKQHIKTDMGTMLALCEKTQNDIRCCVSSLHYFKSQGRPVHLIDVQSSNVGQKDVQKGLFAVWQEVFQIRRQKGGFSQAAIKAVEREAHRNVDAAETKGSDSSLAGRMQNVLRTVQSHGDYDRLAQGVFENYLNMKLRDSSLAGLVIGLDWFCTVDMLSKEIHTSQNYILMPYMSYAFVVWHFLFAGLAWPKITYPNSAYEASVKHSHTVQIVEEVMKGMTPCVRASSSISQLVLDTLPMVADIIVPNLRPVSLQLFSSREKQELCNLVSIMIDFNLTYIQERTPEGAYICKLDPDIEEVVFLGESRPPRSLTYGAKQLVAREIDLEKMRRHEMITLGNPVRTEEPKADKEPQQQKSKKTSPTAVPNHLRKLKPKLVVEEMQTKDFFGRIVNIPVSPSTVKAKKEEKLKGDVWFHFKEGFNNAVRKTVKIADLL